VSKEPHRGSLENRWNLIESLLRLTLKLVPRFPARYTRAITGSSLFADVADSGQIITEKSHWQQHFGVATRGPSGDILVVDQAEDTDGSDRDRTQSGSIILGYLMVRSGYLAKFLGVLWMLSGLGFVINNVISVLAPATISSFLLVPTVLAALSLGLWLLIRGVDVPKWKETEHFHSSEPEWTTKLYKTPHL
jgi:hypothetical protein